MDNNNIFINESSNSSKSNFGDFIFDLVKDFYFTLPDNQIKLLEQEWSVLSAIILQNNNDFKVITFAQGNKSLSNKNYNNMESKILDCHAEVLSLQAFKTFLIKCIKFSILTYYAKTKNDNCAYKKRNYS